jgi:hypothetical protein
MNRAVQFVETQPGNHFSRGFDDFGFVVASLILQILYIVYVFKISRKIFPDNNPCRGGTHPIQEIRTGQINWIRVNRCG